MKVLHDEAAPPSDVKAIDAVRPMLAQLTPAGRRKLLALVARQCLEDAEWTEVPLFNDGGRSFAYVMARPKPEDEFDSELTPAVAAEIVRRAMTPEDSISWQQMLAELDAGDAREARPAGDPPAADQEVAPTSRR
jgi:hypothetical protein